MQNIGKQDYSKSLSVLLACLLITYALGAAYFVMNLFRLQPTPLGTTVAETLSFALVFILGAASTWAAFQHKRLGVYGLILTWTITALLSLIFPGATALIPRLAGMILIAAFLFLIRPVWKGMK